MSIYQNLNAYHSRNQFLLEPNFMSVDYVTNVSSMNVHYTRDRGGFM